MITAVIKCFKICPDQCLWAPWVAGLALSTVNATWAWCLNSVTNPWWFLLVFSVSYLAIGAGAAEEFRVSNRGTRYLPTQQCWQHVLLLAALYGGQLWMLPQLTLPLALVAGRGTMFFLLAFLTWRFDRTVEHWWFSPCVLLGIEGLMFMMVQGLILLGTSYLAFFMFVAVVVSAWVVQEQMEFTQQGFPACDQLACMAPRLGLLGVVTAVMAMVNDTGIQVDAWHALLGCVAAVCLALSGVLTEASRGYGQCAVDDARARFTTALTPLGVLVWVFQGRSISWLIWLGLLAYVLSVWAIAHIPQVDRPWLKRQPR